MFKVSYRSGYLSDWRESLPVRTIDQAKALRDDVVRMGYSAKIVGPAGEIHIVGGEDAEGVAHYVSPFAS
jgi:hypothetical protein